MKCNKCDNKLNEGEFICTLCGNNNSNVEQEKITINNETFNNEYTEVSKTNRGKNPIKIILLAIIGILIVTGGFLLVLSHKNVEEKKVLKQNTYTMYVKINPLVKITVKEEYYECTKNDNTEICSEKSSEVMSYVLVNDDAKAIYSEIDLNGKSVTEALVELCDTAKENDIEVEKLEITTDWKEIYSKTDLMNEIKERSKYKLEITVEIDKEETINTTEILNKYNEKSFIITFNSENGSLVEEQMLKENEKVIKPEDPTREGYEFVEWQLNGKTYNFDSVVTENIELKAVWKKIEVEEKSYTITFNSDGGTKVTSQTIKENGKVTKPENPTKEGYEFIEWQLNGKTYNFDDKVTKNIELKALWKKTTDERVPSSINKINLNDNIYVYSSMLGSGCGRYVFASNVENVFGDDVDASNSVKGNLWIDEIEGFFDKYSMLTFDELKEQQINGLLGDFSSQFPAGVKYLKYEQVEHEFVYSIDVLVIDNVNGSFDSLSSQLMSSANTFNNKVQNLFADSYFVSYKGCGYGGSEPKLLTEEICKEYNLTCDRW